MFLRPMALVAALALLASPAVAQDTLGDDGLHKQAWFHDSFLEMPDDLAEAAAAGKDLMVLFEQAGCPYCEALHSENFTRPEIVEYITDNYLVVQLDLWGSREVVDFDGEAMPEKRLAAKWGVNFTPTTLVFVLEHDPPADFFDVEAFRMPGFLKPFHYLASLEYVATDSYKQQPFQRYLQDKFRLLEEQGITPDVW